VSAEGRVRNKLKGRGQDSLTLFCQEQQGFLNRSARGCYVITDRGTALFWEGLEDIGPRPSDALPERHPVPGPTAPPQDRGPAPAPPGAPSPAPAGAAAGHADAIAKATGAIEENLKAILKETVRKLDWTGLGKLVDILREDTPTTARQAAPAFPDSENA
jgi:hypothetical protein